MSASASRAHSTAGLALESGYSIAAPPSQPLASSAPNSMPIDPALTAEGLFDPMYSLMSSSMSEPGLARNGQLISPLESGDPFDFSVDPLMALDACQLTYTDDMDLDLTEGLTEDMFHVEDWSRYMWSAETGLEHLDTGFPPPVTQ